MSPARGRWSAPGRVNLMGEHMDYNGGPVLPIAINRRTTVTASVHDEAVVTVGSEHAAGTARFRLPTAPGDVTGWAAYVAGVFWAVADAGFRLPGVDLRVTSDIPVGAGLSSSAALECAVAVALRSLGGFDIGDVALALLAQRAENDYVGVPSGAMDQLASMCASAGDALLIDTAAPTVTAVPAHWDADGLHLVVIDTRAQHALGDGEYAARRDESEQAAAALGHSMLAAAVPDDLTRIDDDLLERRTRHVVTETRRVHAAVDALREHRWQTLGELFNESHVSLRDDFEVSSPELDTAVSASLAAGALGARMTGGGFGGSAIALVPAARRTAVAQGCRDAFATEHWQAPTIFTVAPGSGAGRED